MELNMRSFWLLVCLVFTLGFASGQDYRPKPGETVLALAIEGRGNVYIRLHTREAPNTTAQIVKLARSGFYNGQKFHKVLKSPRPYLVQIGDPASKSDVDGAGAGGSGSTVAYEDSGFSNEAGAVGLAAFRDDKNSGDSQFYMLLDKAAYLDKKYTVFGQVVAGMDVLRKVERGDRLQSATILQG